MKSIRESLYKEEGLDCKVIDFCEVAQRSLDYDNYSALLANMEGAAIEYLGICIYGPIKMINKFTGYLGLLR